ncbi:hypothetical protein AALP_AAs46347U000200 [Arabis alpina]|uniref:Uncharacterized protein n=1 Tax=Arabis alpina TaxID=50452 RepID=A0A087FWP4_ARAAL|nr:hypothetical protein AALP_AAs46347U000200 [Arabis alpina]
MVILPTHCYFLLLWRQMNRPKSLVFVGFRVYGK